MEAILAPTDCRLRPDIRAMENGDMGKNTFNLFYWHRKLFLIICKIKQTGKDREGTEMRNRGKRRSGDSYERRGCIKEKEEGRKRQMEGVGRRETEG